jgi:hypothetical protein
VDTWPVRGYRQGSVSQPQKIHRQAQADWPASSASKFSTDNVHLSPTRFGG